MTVVENLHRTAPALRIFDLPKEQEYHLRSLLWKDIRNFNSRLGPGRQIVGLEFRNYMEFSEAILGCRPEPGQRILDVGALLSPLGLYLASKGCEVHVIDVDPIVMRQEQLARDAGLGHLVGQKKFVVQKMDGRQTDFPDDYFDAVIALACVEHTRNEADIELLREVGRVLKPGGRLLLSARYGRRWSEGQMGKWPLRTYSEAALQERLIQQNALTLLRKFYFGDDSLGLRQVWARIPESIRTWAFGWIVYPVAQFISPNDPATKKTANRVCLLFQKGYSPAEASANGVAKPN